MTEKENETWDECEQEVQSLIKDKLKHRNRTSTPNKGKKSETPGKTTTIVYRSSN